MSSPAFPPVELKSPGFAALLSFVLPGAGQIYNGHFWRALFWLIITPGLWIGTGGLGGWICHVVSAWTAHHKAEERNRFGALALRSRAAF